MNSLKEYKLQFMNFSNKDKILVVAAHPDDEILGCCGGTLAKAILNKSKKVRVLFLEKVFQPDFRPGII